MPFPFPGFPRVAGASPALPGGDNAAFLALATSVLSLDPGAGHSPSFPKLSVCQGETSPAGTQHGAEWEQQLQHQEQPQCPSQHLQGHSSSDLIPP